MITVHAQITGTTPLLVNKYTDESAQQKPTRRIEVAENKNPRKEAQSRAYVADDGSFFFNSFAILNAMAAAGTSFKQKGSRKTLRFVVPSAIRMLDGDGITILDEDFTVSKQFEIDSRPVVIPATGGRIIRHRPRWNVWAARFRLGVNEELLDPITAHRLLSEAGQTIGIGDFRPERRGPFGTFIVTEWMPDQRALKEAA